MRGSQAAALAWGAWAAREVGIGRMAGLNGLAARWDDTAEVPPEPEARGPALGDDNAMRATGPFRYASVGGHL
jgi:hypothetical protein